MSGWSTTEVSSLATTALSERPLHLLSSRGNAESRSPFISRLGRLRATPEGVSTHFRVSSGVLCRARCFHVNSAGKPARGPGGDRILDAGLFRPSLSRLSYGTAEPSAGVEPAEPRYKGGGLNRRRRRGTGGGYRSRYSNLEGWRVSMNTSPAWRQERELHSRIPLCRRAPNYSVILPWLPASDSN